MGHATTEMTDRYLNYKNTSDMLMTHQEDYEEYINILLANINKEQL
jgi:hypothetical protein